MANRLAAAVFAGIAVFLLITTWVPGRGSLRQEAGRVIAVTPQANTWHEVGFVTDGGAALSCRSRRGWPALGAGRCPLDAFEALRGQTVQILHDGRRPYEVVSGSRVVLALGDHRAVQFAGLAGAVLMLGMAVAAWRRQG